MGRGRSESTRKIIALAQGVLVSEHPMTLRQLFYRLVSTEAIQNCQGDYQRLSRIMSQAREEGAVPFEWMVDRSRPTYEVNAFRNLGEYAKAVQHSYRRNYWQDQPCHVEVWTEKDAVVGAIQSVTDEYGITVRTGRGFQSTTRVHEIGQEFESHAAAGKEIVVIYLGDHDPSGCCIEEDLQRRVAHAADGVVPFEINRLAIHKKDINDFDLPPLRVKLSDSRARGFLAKHGTECVELDALPPNELRQRLRQTIEDRIDAQKWKRAIRVEQVEIRSLSKIVPRISGTSSQA